MKTLINYLNKNWMLYGWLIVIILITVYGFTVSPWLGWVGVFVIALSLGMFYGDAKSKGL